MNNIERMQQGKVYNPDEPELMQQQIAAQEKNDAYNALKRSDFKGRTRLLKEMFAQMGDSSMIEIPFYANWGGQHVHFGSGVYANFNLTLVDDGEIFVGDSTMFGPNVTIATAGHPIYPPLRTETHYQFNKSVHIGKNVWLGANVTVLPGVTIGDNTVVGAGSVVTKNLPADVVAVGTPCKVLRPINQHDHDYFYKNEKLDIWK